MTGQRDRDPGQTEDEGRPAGERTHDDTTLRLLAEELVVAKSSGDAAANVALSQQRADAVRNALIHAGVDPSMLVAKGYGSANPVASNDLLEGRFRNRRIEYHVLKTT